MSLQTGPRMIWLSRTLLAAPRAPSLPAYCQAGPLRGSGLHVLALACVTPCVRKALTPSLPLNSPFSSGFPVGQFLLSLPVLGSQRWLVISWLGPVFLTSSWVHKDSLRGFAHHFVPGTWQKSGLEQALHDYLLNKWIYDQVVRPDSRGPPSWPPRDWFLPANWEPHLLSRIVRETNRAMQTKALCDTRHSLSATRHSRAEVIRAARRIKPNAGPKGRLSLLFHPLSSFSEPPLTLLSSKPALGSRVDSNHLPHNVHLNTGSIYILNMTSD